MRRRDGSIHNLVIITTKENATKQDNCSMDVNKLIELTDKDKFYEVFKEYKWMARLKY